MENVAFNVFLLTTCILGQGKLIIVTEGWLK